MSKLRAASSPAVQGLVSQILSRHTRRSGDIWCWGAGGGILEHRDKLLCSVSVLLLLHISGLFGEPEGCVVQTSGRREKRGESMCVCVCLCIHVCAHERVEARVKLWCCSSGALHFSPPSFFVSRVFPWHSPHQVY